VFVVDTNVLVYAADRTAPEHERCRARLEEWRRRRSPWFVTWGILYEFLRVTTHPRVFRTPWSAEQAGAFVEALLASPGLVVLREGEAHAHVLAELIAGTPAMRGNLLHDAHTLALMREHGIRTVVTRDADFHRFEGIEVRDPLVD